MQRWNELDDVPQDLGRTVVTIGNFDGVHRGHRAVLGRIVREARRRHVLAVAVTFDPHPLAVLHPHRAPQLICGLEHKLDLLADTGLDAVLVMTFTRELAAWSPEHFVRAAFVEALHAEAVVVGRDMRFGHRNSGDVATLRDLGQQYGFEVVLLEDLGSREIAGEPAPVADGPGQPRRWSSTWVREALAAGDVETAAAVLGRGHRVFGTVVHGDHRGRDLGYPTANLGPDADGLVPQDGVYAGWLAVVDDGVVGERLPAAISVGTNPTFDGGQRRVEAYVLDRVDLDLYGSQVTLEFVQRLRPMVRFETVPALVEQMRLDVEQSRKVLGLAGATSAEGTCGDR